MANLRKRYYAVLKLIDRGKSEGERQAAMAAARRMEASHPELLRIPNEPHIVFGFYGNTVYDGDLVELFRKNMADHLANVFEKTVREVKYEHTRT